eukprot:3058083-Pyramimonas_sp.AAC.1
MTTTFVTNAFCWVLGFVMVQGLLPAGSSRRLITTGARRIWPWGQGGLPAGRARRRGKLPSCFARQVL